MLKKLFKRLETPEETSITMPKYPGTDRLLWVLDDVKIRYTVKDLKDRVEITYYPREVKYQQLEIMSKFLRYLEADTKWKYMR